MSCPAVTFCQSTTATPADLKPLAGRRTTIRVVYGVVPIDVATWPCWSTVGLDGYRVAVPEMKNSCST
jgi:hypothetical protein